MNHPIRWLALACLVGRLSLPGHAAEARQTNPGPPLQLPPMLVEESTNSAPWLYVQAGGAEFLSRCSAGTTRELVTAWQKQLQMIQVLVPVEFLPYLNVPSVFVLYAQDLRQTVSAEIQKELQGATALGDGGVNVAPSMRLNDRDMHAAIAYIDEALFDAAGLSITAGHVRYLLERRVPELPLWLVEGVERMVRGADFLEQPVTLLPLVWDNADESAALSGDAMRPRALLPANELFASGAARAREGQHPRRVETRAGTQGLFARWAIVTGGPMREAYWKFAARAAESPATEERFEECFGFDFAELRDRLSDYLPKAVAEKKWIGPGEFPPLPRIQVERATPAQIARIRGEWERLAIGYVQRRLPHAREPYLAQARRTLHRAYDAGERDPRLLATMALCEIDAGNDAGARRYLDPAVAAGVVRPRAYYELARLRFAELRREEPETRSFTAVELSPVILPLQRALTQVPPLPEVSALLAEAWARCAMSPDAAELAALAMGARLFARRPDVALPTARALARHDRKAEAAAVLDACVDYATEPGTRAEIARLRAELK